MHNGRPRKRKEERAETTAEEIMANIFPNLMEDMHLPIHKAKQTTNKTQEKLTTHSINCLKVRDRILKAARPEQLFVYNGSSIRLGASFASKTTEARRQ